MESERYSLARAYLAQCDDFGHSGVAAKAAATAAEALTANSAHYLDSELQHSNFASNGSEFAIAQRKLGSCEHS